MGGGQIGETVNSARRFPGPHWLVQARRTRLCELRRLAESLVNLASLPPRQACPTIKCVDIGLLIYDLGSISTSLTTPLLRPCNDLRGTHTVGEQLSNRGETPHDNIDDDAGTQAVQRSS